MVNCLRQVDLFGFRPADYFRGQAVGCFPLSPVELKGESYIEETLGKLDCQSPKAHESWKPSTNISSQKEGNLEMFKGMW